MEQKSADQSSHDQLESIDSTTQYNSPLSNPVPDYRHELQAVNPPDPAPAPRVSVTPPVGPTSSSIDIVWQWLSYALWELLLASLAVLISAIFTYYFNHSTSSNTRDLVIYSLVIVLCLVPFAFFADRIYRHREPDQKRGFAAVVMVLNAIPVFLTALAAFVATVIALVSILVNANGSPATSVFIASASSTALLSGLLFIRIIHRPQMKRFSNLFPVIVLGIALVALVLGAAGPFRSEITDRHDSLIEDNLAGISNDIQDHADADNNLPSSLHFSELNQDGVSGEQTLVNKHEVTYTRLNSEPVSSTSGLKLLRYQLCVTYDHPLGNGKNSTSTNGIDTSHHSSGLVCYTQSVDVTP
jgi:hypothetical protein